MDSCVFTSVKQLIHIRDIVCASMGIIWEISCDIQVLTVHRSPMQ